MSGSKSGSQHDLFKAFLDRKLGRRELVERAAKLGIGGVAAGFLLNRLGTEALAQSADHDWKKNSGKTVRLLLNKHPYTDAMLANLESL
jgi:multiple sugar transport system substrate-binding protein